MFWQALIIITWLKICESESDSPWKTSSNLFFIFLKNQKLKALDRFKEQHQTYQGVFHAYADIAN